MLAQLTAYHGCKVIQLPKEDKTFGPGKLGAKSFWLRQCKDAAEATMIGEDDRTGLIYLPNVAMTSGLFASDFLKRAGADHANKDSAAAIMRTPLTDEIKEYVREIFALYPELYLVFRSDECTASGVGLWHTGFVLANGDATQLERAEHEIKRILASEYSPDVLAFKTRTGLPLAENPGVLVMPVAGYRYPRGQPRLEENGYTSFFHLNVITRFIESIDPLVHLGVGIGGANRKGAVSSPLSRLNSNKFSLRSLSDSLSDSRHLVDGKLVDDRTKQETIRTLLQTFGSQASDIISELERSLEIFDGVVGRPMYLELPLAALFPVLVQAAPMNMTEPVKPKVNENDMVLTLGPSDKTPMEEFGSRVSGRCTVHAKRYLYLDRTDTLELGKHNRDLRDYVVFIEGTTASLRDHLSFADYSNAAAIVIIDELPRYNVRRT